MVNPEFPKTAKIIVQDMMGIQPEEEVAILIDSRTPIDLGEAFMGAVESVNAKPTIVAIPMPPFMGKGAWPMCIPTEAAEAAVEEADVIIDMALGYADCILEAVKAGKRVMGPGVWTHTDEVLIRTVGAVDIYNLAEESKMLADLWTEADTARITSKEGTDLQLDIRGVYGTPLSCFVRPNDPEKLGFLPQAQPGIIDKVPMNGTVAFDGAVLYGGRLEQPRTPVILKIEKGRIMEMTGDALIVSSLKAFLDSFDDPIVFMGPGHVNLGTNPTARITPHQEWERIRGSMVVCFGDNTHLSGLFDRPKKLETIKAGTHWDALMLRPTLYLDERVVIKDGRIMI